MLRTIFNNTKLKATHRGCFFEMQPVWVAFLLHKKQYKSKGDTNYGKRKRSKTRF